MKKEKKYKRIKLSQSTILDCLFMLETKDEYKKKINESSFKVTLDDETWKVDTIDEFFQLYERKCIDYAYIIYSNYSKGNSFDLTFSWGNTTIEIGSKDRAIIDRISNYISTKLNESKLSEADEEYYSINRAEIFVGHGRHSDWRDLKDHLADKHGHKVIAYETGSRVGKSIVDVLEEMSEDASLSIIVMTAENKDEGGLYHARSNVIHEIGLMQGKLGFHRVIILLEEGCEEFSNISGIQYIPYKKGHISGTFGEVLAVIKREFAR